MTSSDDNNNDRPGTADSRDIVGPTDSTPSARLPFPVVGIGASAGGIQALEDFFGNVDVDSGMAYVVIQHLSPDHTSMLEEILSRRARIPVEEVEDGMEVQVNHAYVIAPGYTLTIADGRLHLGDPVEKRGHRRPVDDFLRSLAEEQSESADRCHPVGQGTNGTAGCAGHQGGRRHLRRAGSGAARASRACPQR